MADERRVGRAALEHSIGLTTDKAHVRSSLVGMSQRNGVTNTELTSLPAGGCGFGVPHATMDRLE
eukprot:9277199-Pyramimonas_sp.AAC.1